MPSRQKRSLQERLEASDTGRALISAFVLVTIAALVITNLSSSKLKADLSRRTQPYINALSLDQGWGVFAPNPRRLSLAFFARVRYADGTTGTWRMPSNGPVVGHFHDNRWRKWMELAISNAYTGMYRPAAIHIARDMSDGGKRPTRVTLVRRWQVLLPPGGKRTEEPWRQDDYYRLRISPKMLEDA